MQVDKLPRVQLRELTLADVEDRYQWCKDKEVTKHLNMTEKFPGFHELELNKIWLRVEIDNERAIKSYIRMGYVEEGILRQDQLRNGVFVDRIRMSLLKNEFLCKS